MIRAGAGAASVGASGIRAGGAAAAAASGPAAVNDLTATSVTYNVIEDYYDVALRFTWPAGAAVEFQLVTSSAAINAGNYGAATVLIDWTTGGVSAGSYCLPQATQGYPGTVHYAVKTRTAGAVLSPVSNDYPVTTT